MFTVTPQLAYQNTGNATVSQGWKHWLAYGFEARLAFARRHSFSLDLHSMDDGLQAGLAYALYF